MGGFPVRGGASVRSPGVAGGGTTCRPHHLCERTTPRCLAVSTPPHIALCGHFRRHYGRCLLLAEPVKPGPVAGDAEANRKRIKEVGGRYLALRRHRSNPVGTDYLALANSVVADPVYE